MDVTWTDQAACKGLPLEVMVPPRDGHHQRGEQRRTKPNAAEQQIIDTFCAVCPVKERCLQDALEFRDLGIRGGTIDAQRRRRRPSMRVEASDLYVPRKDPGAPAADVEHGVRQGYVRGCRCAACREAVALYRRAERAASRKPALTGADPSMGSAAGSPEDAGVCALSSGARPASGASWKRLHRVVVR